VSATPLPAPRAAPTVSQDEIDASWANVVAKAASATPSAAAPTPVPADASARWPSAAESDAIWASIAASLNASAGVKPRGLSKPK
jgi:hypothetical protein